MIPSPWVGIVLALGVARVVRLVGWDEMPLVERARAWAVGQHVRTSGSQNTRMGLTSEQVENTVAYHRPTLARFLGCPFCVGFWLCIATYVAWRLEPSWTLTALAVFALSEAVGLICRRLDT